MDGHGGSPVTALPGGLWEAGQVHIIELNADMGLQDTGVLVTRVKREET